MADLVKMLRDEPQHPGGPTTADVHPEEVGVWAVAGWRLAPAKPNTHEAAKNKANEGLKEEETAGGQDAPPAKADKKKAKP